MSNPTDTSNSIVRAELQITYFLENDIAVTCRIQHNQALAEESASNPEDAAKIFSLPSRIDAHETLSGWFLFSLDDNVIGQGTVDSHSLVLEDTHSISTDSGPIMVREWTHEAPRI